MISVDTYTAILNQLLPEPHAGLLNGILFGIKATIPKDFMDALIRTGTLHIVALSGMNITILESLVAGFLLPVVGRRNASLLTILLIVGFIWFVGLSPSVIRAGLMGSMALIATIFGRQKWSIFFFAMTIVIMLVIHPAWIGDLSFQLSALATIGIILFGTKRKEAVSAAPADVSNVPMTPARKLFGAFIEEDLRLTLAAQVFTIPLIFFTFHRVSFVSPLTNVLIGWIIQPLTVIGLLTAIVGWVWLPLGQVIAWVAWLLLQYIILMISWTAHIPFSSVGW